MKRIWKVRTPNGATLAVYASRRMAEAAARRIHTRHARLDVYDDRGALVSSWPRR